MPTPDAAITPNALPQFERGGGVLTPLLEVQDLQKHFPIRTGFFRKITGAVKAVDGVSFQVMPGETLGVVGESGCGKTTVGRCLMRLIEPTAGTVRLTVDGKTHSLLDLSPVELKRLRPHIQMVFQDPQASLNSRMTVQDIVAEPLIVNNVAKGKEAYARVAELLKAVGLRPEAMRRYPHAFSGGQRQRIGIARALALHPKLIIADEPVSALDVSVQAQVLNLLADLRKDLGLSYIFIAHDLGVVEHISDRVAVMYLGRIVEIGATERLFANPKHPYTEALLSAVPVADPAAQKQRQRIRLKGDVPSPANPPKGCRFHPRCRYAQPICSEQDPPLRNLPDGTSAACHFAGELNLQGVEPLQP
jgi:peptide/nickel transport system ATP-binding protein